MRLPGLLATAITSGAPPSLRVPSVTTNAPKAAGEEAVGGGGPTRPMSAHPGLGYRLRLARDKSRLTLGAPPPAPQQYLSKLL